jgi:phosphatidylglycerophosphate synthase
VVSNARSVPPAQAADVVRSRSAGDFKSPTRIQTSLLAARERALLDHLCRKAPAWVTPDRLTAVGSLGAVIACSGYVASNWAPAFLFLASLGIVINWFGDSLDGSLARHRRIERAKYGYFLDHSVDAANNLIFAIGLGASPYVSMAAALFLLCSYYLLSIRVFLSAQINREFNLTYAYVGPTELRLIAVAFNCGIYLLGPHYFGFGGATVSVYSLLVLLEAAAFTGVFVFEVYATARDLRREDAGGADPAAEVNGPGRGGSPR